MELKEFIQLSNKDRHKIAERLAGKGYQGDLNYIAELGKKRTELIGGLDQARAEHNRLSEEREVEAGKLAAIKVADLESQFKKINDELMPLWRAIPNVPDKDVPEGGEADSKLIGESKLPPRSIANPRDHIELGEALNIIDIERGVKVSGSRFYFLKNEAAELEFALIRWLFKILKKKGFELLVTPQIINEEVMEHAGYVSKSDRHAAEVYHIDDPDNPDRHQYLIGTSEQSVLGYHMDEIIEVPKRYAAFSTCFRKEAGSYGQDVKGIIRTHQFDKVELFSFVAPEDSQKEFKTLVAIQEFILKKLEIPYRKMLVAAGDLGMPAARQIDLESWIPSQNRYRETHSCSNCTDWQAQRANIRYRAGHAQIKSGEIPVGFGKPTTQYVHTLNGTGIAVGRMLAVLLENYQQEDGNIKVPDVLCPYVGFSTITNEHYL